LEKINEEEEEKFACFEIDSDETKRELNIEQGDLQYYLNPEKVLLIVRDDVRRIYIWKGARSSVKKRFLASQLAPKLQKELREKGYHRCRIKAVEQCDEIQEFLNLFGLESMDVEKLEDKYYYLNSKREEARIFIKLSQEHSYSASKEMMEIEKKLEDQKILWVKNSTTVISQEWLDSFKSNEQFNKRLLNIKDNPNMLGSQFKNVWVIANESILTHSELNKLYDYSAIPERYFEMDGNIAKFDVFGIKTIDVTKTEDKFNISINCFPNNETVFYFEGLSLGEYLSSLNIFTNVFSFRAKVPEQTDILTYIQKEGSLEGEFQEETKELSER